MNLALQMLNLFFPACNKFNFSFKIQEFALWKIPTLVNM